MAETLGPILCSGTTNGNTLPLTADGGELREITLAPLEVGNDLIVSGKSYAITVAGQYAGEDYAGWAYEYPHDRGDYADGDQWNSFDTGETWTPRAFGQYDYYFVTKASGVEKDSYTFPPWSGITYLRFGPELVVQLGQSFLATASYALTSVVLQLALWPDNDNPGILTVSLREVIDVPTKAANPTPTNANSDVTLDHETVTWEDGGGADTYNVYYGDTSGALTLVSAAQAATEFTVWGIGDGSPYDYEVTRYWRIDSTNAAGTTTGDEWSFTTLSEGYVPPYPPPRPDPYDPDVGGGGSYATNLLVIGHKVLYYRET